MMMAACSNIKHFFLSPAVKAAFSEMAVTTYQITSRFNPLTSNNLKRRRAVSPLTFKRRNVIYFI
jgi:hypothetical protein